MNLNKSVYTLVLLMVISTCTSTSEINLEETPALISSPELTSTIEPTPTLDPTADPDGDGYRTSFEEAWGTDPLTFTNFDDLKELDKSISFILHMREPYNLEDMNATVYQQVKFIEEKMISDSGYWDDGPYRTLTIEVVLFPYVTDVINEYVKELEIPYIVPSNYATYLLPTRTSDLCEELYDVIRPIIEKSKTLHELGLWLEDWNSDNLTRTGFNEGFNAGNIRQAALITSCEMIRAGMTMASTTRANLCVSEFRAASLPSGVSISFDPTDVDLESHLRHLKEHSYRASDHPQTLVWTPSYGWVVYDFCVKFFSRDNPGLFIAEIVPDYNDSNKELWKNSDDGNDVPRGHPQPDWLYYIEELKAPKEYMSYLEPADW